jgi:hypothetical protein
MANAVHSLPSALVGRMSNSISTLLLRNLSDVFGENDPVRRRAAIDEVLHEDAVSHDPKDMYISWPWRD